MKVDWDFWASEAMWVVGYGGLILLGQWAYGLAGSLEASLNSYSGGTAWAVVSPTILRFQGIGMTLLGIAGLAKFAWHYLMEAVDYIRYDLMLERVREGEK